MINSTNTVEYEEEIIEDDDDYTSRSLQGSSSYRGSNGRPTSDIYAPNQMTQPTTSYSTRKQEQSAKLTQSELISRQLAASSGLPLTTYSGRQSTSSSGQKLDLPSSGRQLSASMGPNPGSTLPQQSGALSNRPPQVASSLGSVLSPQQQKPTDDPGVTRMRHWVVILGLLILICLAVAAIVIPLYVPPQFKSTSNEPITTPMPSTQTPSSSPSETPGTTVPTSEDFASFVKNFAKDISGSEVFENSDSPQFKAADFIAIDANFSSTLTNDATLGDFYAVSVFYFSTGGQYWFECSKGSKKCPGVSWMTNNVIYCEWSWITCNENGRVRDIIFGDVKGNNLTGTLMSEMALLTELEKFVVINDDLSGSLPNKIGELTEVTHFILSNNSFSGNIPGSFLETSPLEVVMLSDNDFRGPVPDSLTKQTTLYQLFLDNNRFSGTIPSHLGSLPNLSTLDLSRNQFSGAIPDDIYTDVIQNLYLGGSTELQGTISSAVGFASNLVRLHITGTRISSGIPDELFTLPFLTEIVLSNNTLTGELSGLVADLGGTLRVLELDGNKFSGNLPNVAIDELLISNILRFDRKDRKSVV